MAIRLPKILKKRCVMGSEMKPKIIEMNQIEIESLIEKLEKGTIEKADCEKIKNILESYLGFKDEILKKKASI